MKQNDTLNTMYEKKKNEYDQQVNRSEELAGQNAEHLADLKLKVTKIILHTHM